MDASSSRARGQDATDFFTEYRQRKRFGSLNGLRFLCIAGVLWHHAPAIDFATTSWTVLKRGFVGVDFFFILSGFLITTLLLRETARDGSFSILNFYWRRILRIVPVYFFVVTAVSVYYVLIRGEAQYAALVPYYYLFLSNFLTEGIPTLGPLWSLAVEEQYYLVWPLLLMLVPRRMVLPVLVLLIAANVAGIMGSFAMLGIIPIETDQLRIALPPATYAPILLGSAVAVLLHNERGFVLLFRLLGHRGAPIFTFAGLLILLQFAPPDLRGLPNLAIHLMMSACLVTLLLRGTNILTPILSWRPIARVGEISYGIYLYHLIALHIAGVGLVQIGMGSPWPVLIGYSLLSIAIAEVSFRTLEAYFRKLKHRRPGGVRKAAR